MPFDSDAYWERERIVKIEREAELKLSFKELSRDEWGKIIQLPEELPISVKTNPKSRKLMLD